MEKIIFTDNSSFEIKEGCSISEITAILSNFTSLNTLADMLLNSENLINIIFESNENITGKYSNMKLVKPLFHSVDIVDDKVEATFSLREKTELELEIDAIKSEQEIQDEAIAELGNVVSDMSTIEVESEEELVKTDEEVTETETIDEIIEEGVTEGKE